MAVRLLIIAGMPASGKSTVASLLAKKFGYPVLEKDELKEALFDTVGFECYAEKRRLDTAATAVLLRASTSLIEGGVSHVIVNNFRTDFEEEVRRITDRKDVNALTVFFSGDSDVFYQRYVDRDLRLARHLGHALQEHYPPREGDPETYAMTREEFREKFEALGMDSFDAGCKRIEVDATYPDRIDIDSLAEKIEKAFSDTEKAGQN